ncbi:MAG: DUF2808 domain-containing protein, partial [Kamptonema sp. SIO4C4]|nr:DUF2808 domain-containing protein [Kamptonema sp. SIO4C4]
MAFSKLSKYTALASLALAGAVLTALPTLTVAQSNSGITIFSGVNNREDILDYHIDFPNPNTRSRYKLRIPATKMELGVSQIVILYPAYYRGRLDTDEITVGYGSGYNEQAAIEEVVIEENAVTYREQG